MNRIKRCLMKENENKTVIYFKIKIWQYILIGSVVSIFMGCYFCERTNIANYLQYYRTSVIYVVLFLMTTAIHTVFIYLILKAFKIKINYIDVCKMVLFVECIYLAFLLLIDLFVGHFIENELIGLLFKTIYFLGTLGLVLKESSFIKKPNRKNIIWICVLYLSGTLAISIIKYLI